MPGPTVPLYLNGARMTYFSAIMPINDGLGLVFASRMKDMQGFGIVMNFIIFPFFFLSGALTPLENFPWAVRALSYVDPLTYGVDGLRGVLAALWLRPDGARSGLGPPTLEQLAKLLGWLAATGDFEHEVKRFEAWRAFLEALPDSIDRWMPRPLVSLGTDGFGRSEGRASLRDFFEVDAKHIVEATLSDLAREGQAVVSGIEAQADASSLGRTSRASLTALSSS